MSQGEKSDSEMIIKTEKQSLVVLDHFCNFLIKNIHGKLPTGKPAFPNKSASVSTVIFFLNETTVLIRLFC